MGKEINVAEILKDKPKGTKLYDLLYNVDVELDKISTTDTETVVCCTNDTDNNTTCHRGYSEFGTLRGCPDGLQILLPSKEMRNWSKFAWKKGDVLVGVGQRIIFEKFIDENYTRFQGKYSLSTCEDETLVADKRCYTSDFRKLDDSGNVKNYFKELEEKLGGKLNRETLEVEKQPEFKDGDIVVYGESVAICRKIYKDTLYFYVSINDVFGLLFNEHVVSSEGYRFATDEDKQRLFEALEKENKAWDNKKKEVVDLKPKWTPKPFDRVITRLSDDSIWTANIFSHVDQHGKYVTIGCLSGYHHCIPYNEETAKLIGTTNNWEG